LRYSKGSIEVLLGGIWTEASLSIGFEAIVLGFVSETILVEAPRSTVKSVEGARIDEDPRSIVRSVEINVTVEVSLSIVGPVGPVKGSKIVKVDVTLRTIRIEAIVLGFVSETILVEAPRSIVEVSLSIVGPVGPVKGIKIVKVEVALRTIRIEAIVLGSILIEISEAVLVEVSSLWSDIGSIKGSCIVLRAKTLSPSEHGISFGLRFSLSVGGSFTVGSVLIP